MLFLILSLSLLSLPQPQPPPEKLAGKRLTREYRAQQIGIEHLGDARLAGVREERGVRDPRGVDEDVDVFLFAFAM